VAKKKKAKSRKKSRVGPRAYKRDKDGRPEWFADFLATFKDTGSVEKACDAAGIGRSTAYDWRGKDKAFDAAWQDLDDVWLDRLENGMMRRALVGSEKPVFSNGKQVGVYREFNFNRERFILERRRKRKWGQEPEADRAPADTAAAIRAFLAKADAVIDADKPE